MRELVVRTLMVGVISLARTNEVIAIARSWLGTPYHHQASVKGIGCDCVGLIRGIYTELYQQAAPEVINYSPDWGDSNGNEGLIAVADKYLEPVASGYMMPGDVVLVRWAKHRVAKHCMLLTGDNTAIHAYNRSPVIEIHLSNWWQDKIVAAYSFPQEVKNG